MVNSFTFAKVCTGIISFACLVGGIFLFQLASEETHEKKKADFDEAVDNWPPYRAGFSNLNISAAFINGAFRSGSSALAPSSFNDAVEFKNGEDLLPYEPLSYRLPQRPRDFMPVVKFQDIEWEETGGKKLEHGGVAMRLNVTVDGIHLLTEAIPLVRARAHRQQKGLYNQCRLRKGAFMNGKCWVYAKLTSICLQIVRNGSRWQFAPRVPGDSLSYGCAKKHDSNWTVGVYKELELVPNDPSGEAAEQGIRTAVVQTITFDDFKVVVREVHDPFLKALEVTDGNLDFGMTSEEERWLAMVLLIMAVLLAMPPVCGICLWWRKKAKRNRPRRPAPRMPKQDKAEMIGMKYAVSFEDEEYDVK